MGLLSWMVMGFLAGALARLVLPGTQPYGCLVTVVIGVVGAVVGGFLAAQLGFGGITGFDLRSLIISVFGAVVFLVLVRLFRSN